MGNLLYILYTRIYQRDLFRYSDEETQTKREQKYFKKRTIVHLLSRSQFKKKMNNFTHVCNDVHLFENLFFIFV